MCNVLITGTATGIGRSTALKFLSEGHVVYAIDIKPSTIIHKNYHHYICDVRDVSNYPELPAINILINNAGIQGEDDINVNLLGTINITERYGLQCAIKSILMNASVSAHTGAEFPRYAASKGGILAYTKNVAMSIAQYGATCNSISLGGVLTDLNNCVITDDNLWNQIMELTPLKKWMTPEECADWIYFVTVINKSMTGQDILIDNGESSMFKFVWKDEEQI